MSAKLDQLAAAVARRLADPEHVALVADAVADRLAELLADRERAPAPAASATLTAAKVAERFGVSREFVYEHADELGAIRLGDGERPRLRFDAHRVYEALAARPAPTAQPAKASPRRRQPPSEVPLLPIRGRS